MLPSAPWLDYEAIRRRADSFLEEYHPSKTIPIPIEEIAEFKLKLDIVPLPGLRNIDVEGFLYGDLSAIAVDQGIFEHKNTSRYRFTLAHEIGHLVLHSQLYKAFKINKIGDYLEFQKNLSPEILDKVEWQGHCFAGLALVPAEPLETEVKRTTKRVVEMVSKSPNNKILRQVEGSPDLLRDIVEKEVAKIFEVSQDVIARRVRYDKLDINQAVTEAIRNLNL